MNRKVDFFVCGVQKAGTTALDMHLRTNPGVQMARVKEVHHFDDEAVDWSAPNHERLHGMFDWGVPAVLRGECTPIYLYWPNALARLQRYNPSARLIVGLRHPSLRAFSHWRMETARGSETLPFSTAISAAGRNRVRCAPCGAHRVFSYVERGQYAPQIRNLLEFFPRSQLHFYRTDALWAETGRVLEELGKFLGASLDLPTRRRYVAPVRSADLGSMAMEDREFLDDHYRDDIIETSKLIGMDLTDWLEPLYAEEMRPSDG